MTFKSIDLKFEYFAISLTAIYQIILLENLLNMSHHTFRAVKKSPWNKKK